MGRPRKADLEEEEDEVQEQPPPVERKGLQAFQCPECIYRETDYEKVPFHMERHRPMGAPLYSPSGRLLSVACKNGCGRYFTATKNVPPGERDQDHNPLTELRVHLIMCDGKPQIQPEIPKKEEPIMPKQKNPSDVAGCYYHPELTFKSGQARGQHLKYHHPDWPDDPKLNLKLQKEPAASRALVPAETAVSRSITKSATIEFGATPNPEQLIELGAKTAEGVRDLVTAYRQRAHQYTQRADELESQASKMEADVRS